MRTGVLVFGWVTLQACQAALAPSQVNAPPPAAVSASAALSAPAAVAPPISPQPTTIAELSQLSELACDARIFILTGRTFVSCGPALLFLDEAHSLRRDAALAAGLGVDAAGVFPPRLVGMAGQWPNAAWAAIAEEAGNNSVRLRFFRWRRDRWVASGSGVEVGVPMEWVVFPWQESGIAALAPTPYGPTRVLASSGKPGAVPALTPAVQTKAERGSYPCKHALVLPEAWAELAPGDVMVFSGQLCSVSTKNHADVGQMWGMGLERLRAGQKQGALTLLPLPSDAPVDMSWNVTGAAALSPSDACVAATGFGSQIAPDEPRRGYLAHWNGQDWQQEVAPFTMLTGLWAQAGAFWALDQQGALWTRRRGRWSLIQWKKPRAPSVAEPAHSEQISQLVAIDAENIWLVRREERGPEVTSRIYRLLLEPEFGHVSIKGDDVHSEDE